MVSCKLCSDLWANHETLKYSPERNNSWHLGEFVPKAQLVDLLKMNSADFTSVCPFHFLYSIQFGGFKMLPAPYQKKKKKATAFSEQFVFTVFLASYVPYIFH